MASLLESLEHQYGILTSEIATKTALIPTLTSAEKKVSISQVEHQLDEAREVLEQMDLEVRGMPQAAREKNLLPYRMKNYNSQLSDLEKGLYKARMTVREDESAREEFFESDSYVKDEQKQCLLDNIEKLERSSRQLDNGYRLAIETEQIGSEILSNLHTQRETISKTKERLRDTNYDIGKSSRILSGMIRGLLQQRVILSLVIIGLVITIIIAIYFIAVRS